ncbi:MAG: prolyl aminopeptidase [Gammaproteobacteria bacterium]|nr:prolyl aminopeptidase [Gammaproteobacteria bacterium]
MSHLSSQPVTFYPPIEPFSTGQLPVGDGHLLYFEQTGNPQGIPVLFLHGGPGAACAAWQRRFFDPQCYHIILFDQRGCGRSQPHAELQHNSTQHLVNDIELLRQHLSIAQWLVFGGSWGSTLALVYAQTHPAAVLGLILRGIFLCRPADIDWFYQFGASEIWPDEWAHYLAPIPVLERQQMVAAYYQRLISDDAVIKLNAAKAWSRWEAATARLQQDPQLLNNMTADAAALAMARIECHYFMQQSFLRPNQIIEDIANIRHIPSVIVHGRYDVICPLRQAWDLHCAWPEAYFQIINTAGHSAMEVDITQALILATQQFARTSTFV